MTDPGLLRFLELVIRELGATDARVEIGGRDPDDPRLVFRPIPSGGRVVAVFATPPSDPEASGARLSALMESFFTVADHAAASVPPPSKTPADIAQRRLVDELGRLRERAGARAAVVFDVESPVVWGMSPQESPGLESRFADTMDRVRQAHAELSVGHTSRLSMMNGVECLARPFAGIYVLALLFDVPGVSEPVAIGAMVHALPTIERLVLALPPAEPPRGGAKIMRMPPRLR